MIDIIIQFQCRSNICMSDSQTKLETEIQTLKDVLQTYEDTDPAYMSKEMKELHHFTSFTHMRMEESLGSLVIKNMLTPVSESVSQKTYQQVLFSGTSIAVEIDFARKVDLAKTCGEIDADLGGLMHKVNDLRKWFSHPSKFNGKLDELKRDRGSYKNALSQLVNAHKRMNKIFEKYLQEKNNPI